jgi:rare lipoprotein A
MVRIRILTRLAMTLLLSSVIVAAGCKPHPDAKASEGSLDQSPRRIAKAATRAPPDLSGRTRFGDASFYAKEFAGREMADGSKMDPLGDNAASKTLPLGTRARVTNITTGQSALVTIQDLSPSTARKIGITQDAGVAKVKVTPVSVPPPNGSVKPGIEAPN